jgi:uncharacterized membrane protein
MASEPQPTPTRPYNLLRRVAQWFLAGVLTILPVAITVSIIAWAAGFLRQLVAQDTPVGSFLRRFGLHFASDDTLAYLIGVVLVLAWIPTAAD